MTISFDHTVRVRFAPSPTGTLHIGIGAHRPLQLPRRPPQRRQLRRAHRRHRRGALRGALRARHPRRPRLAGPRLGRGAGRGRLPWPVSPERAPRDLPRGGRPAAGRRSCLPLLLQPGAPRRRCALAALAHGRPPRYDGTCRRLDPGRPSPPASPPANRPPCASLCPAATWPSTTSSAGPIAIGSLRTSATSSSCAPTGGPSYNFAAVVDDAAMAITHVLRGDDHLTNTARQELLRRALRPGSPGARLRPPRHDPGGRRRQAVQTPRGYVGGRLP